VLINNSSDAGEASTQRLSSSAVGEGQHSRLAAENVKVHCGEPGRGGNWRSAGGTKGQPTSTLHLLR
jgi:hypothetical protein